MKRHTLSLTLAGNDASASHRANSRASLFKILQEKSVSPSSILIQVQDSPLIFQGLEILVYILGKAENKYFLEILLISAIFAA